MKYRCGIITEKGNVISENFNSRNEIETWLLKQMDKVGVKHYKVINRETKELLETEKKQYDKGDKK